MTFEKCYFALFFLILVVPQTAVGDVQIIEMGEYVGRLYSDGSGSIGKRFDPNVTMGCKSVPCQNDRKNADKNTVFKDTWSFILKNDDMTDDQEIIVRRHSYKVTDDFGEIKLDSNLYLWMSFSNAENEVLCVVGHNFPGKKAMIRVDSNDPIETGENGCLRIDGSIDSQLRRGNALVIRGYHWPYDGAETWSISLGGYIETSEFLRGQRR